MAAVEINTVIMGASAFAGALGGVGTIAWWLSKEFQKVYDHVQVVKDHIIDKVDAHEKLDAARFEQQQLAIMRLELLAQNDGKGLHRI